MACHTPVCEKCNDFKCPNWSGNGNHPCMHEGKKNPKILESFDTAGALCNLLTMLEGKYPSAFAIVVDAKTRKWWKAHEESEQEKIKKEALAKLTPREKRALNLG